MAEKRVAKVSKTYSRKVSLKGLSSKYDNIECGTMITVPIEFEDAKELSIKLQNLQKAVMDETEKDISKTISNLFEMSKDVKNNAVLGIGIDHNNSACGTGDLSTIEGLDELIAEEKDIELPLDMEEVDIDSL